MRIAIINEVSACDKNKDILMALSGRGYDIYNIGMTQPEETPALSYLHTGLMTALVLNTDMVDFVVGGCGTGQGYLNSIMQYPGVFAGHILTSLDAWLFRQINGGNAISLALNQGYGWAADVNLRFIFDTIFSVESGRGYPEHRREAQQESRIMLNEISKITHRSLAEIIEKMPNKIINTILSFPAFKEFFKFEQIVDDEIKQALLNRSAKVNH